MKIFQMMKGIFGKSASSPDSEGFSTEVITVAEARHQRPPVATIVFERAQAPITITPPATASAAPTVTTSDDSSAMLSLPLSSIVSAFPAELQERVNAYDSTQVLISLPLQRILSQVSQGVVRVTYGEVRNSAPTSFSPDADQDETLLTLPLGELVKRLGPAIRNIKVRRQISVPEDITNPFNTRGDGTSIGSGAKVSDTQFARNRGGQPAGPASPNEDPRGRSNVTSVRKPELPGASSLTDTNVFQRRSQAPAPAAPATPPPSAPLISAAGLPQPIKPAIKPTISNHGSNGNGSHSAAAPAGSNGGDQAALWVALNVISEAWPDEVRLEISQANLGEAKVALPVDLVDTGLKSGKVVFTWKQIRSAIKPAVAPVVSAYDGLQLNIPLAIIAPLFMARKKQMGSGQKKVAVDEKIPDLFFGFPQPEAPAVVEAAPAPSFPSQKKPENKVTDTNYFIWDDDKETAQAQDAVLSPARPSSTPGTTFASRKSTPNQVVMKASMLEGVYGALVTLPDGLPVACKLDPSQNGDTIAALIPQMYSKLSGCTKELRMGELNNLNFTVGNVPWKIFRVNGIFFAAFGCAGEPLPTAQLAELAAELDYKKAQ